MSRLIFTDKEHILDQGTPLWAPRGDPTETDKKVWAALEALTDRQREVVEMRVWAEWTFKQIGAKLGISKQAAHSTYDRAMLALKGELDEDTERTDRPTH